MPTSTTPSTRPPSAPSCTRARSACRRARSSWSGRSPTRSSSGWSRRRRLKVGDPRERDTIIGPLINAEALGARCRRRVDEAVAAGARVLAGGRRRGRVLPGRRCSPTCPPTPISPGTRRSARCASIEVVDSADEAVARGQRHHLRSGGRHPHQRSPSAASRSRGSSSRASSTSTTSRCTTSRRCRSAASRTAAGAASAGRVAMDEFTELRWITVQSGTRPFPF